MSQPISPLDKFFSISERKSTVPKELLAGLATYLSLAYIFIVNPSILAQSGIDVSAVFFATILASAVSTIFMGLYARLPFALAPGLEMNGFFAFVVVGAMGLTWNQALGAVFWSGLLCLVLAILPIRKAIIDAIPDGLKKSLAISVGVFVMTIGLFLAGIVSFDGPRISAVHFSFDSKVIALIIGLVISMILGIKRLGFPAGMLVAIIVATVYCKANGILVENPAKADWSAMTSAIGKFDLMPTLPFLPVFLVFFLLDFYGSIGKFIGLTSSTKEMLNPDGSLPRMKEAMVVDGAGTVLGAAVGTSSIITFVESAIGIKTGGRTGLTALVCGLLMFASLAFTPLVGLVPVQATAGILIYVGFLLMRDVDSKDDRQVMSHTSFWIVVALMGLISFLTFSLDKAMLLGFLVYCVADTMKHKKANWYLVVSTLLIAVSVILPFLLK